jgi:ATP-binding cassette, subfamily B, bacterial
MSSPKSFLGMRHFLKHFRPYLLKERRLIAGATGAVGLETALKILEPWPLALLFDVLLIPKDSAPAFLLALEPQRLLLYIALALVVIVGLRALAAYWNTIGFALAGNRVLTRVRSDLYSHMQRLSLDDHNKSKQGDMVMRVMSDVGMLKDVLVGALLPLMVDALMFVGMFGVMLWLDWRLALLSLLMFPLFYLTSLRLGRQIQEVSRKQRKRDGAMASTAAEAIAAIKTVQALSLENTFSSAFNQHNQKSLKEGVRATRLSANLERTVDVLIAGVTALILYFGAQLVLSQSISAGDLLVFLSYLKSAFKPVRDMAKYTARLAKASAAAERVMEVLKRPRVQNAPGAIDMPPVLGEVSFENVSFAYEGKLVLKNISFSARAGQRVAIVGPSGSGKSTLLSLLPRLYPPTLGGIFIDRCDIRTFTLSSLRSNISLVLQDGLLFSMSVRDNIALMNPSATDKEVVRAAKLARAHEFICQLPQGYDTVLGERGVTLSGGQRQRLAIARAALRKAPFLLLDEPTTGLDEDNQRLVMEALEHLSRGCTSFIVTHDLKLASRADLILYLENGALLEQGSHEHLISLGGRYASLYLAQLGVPQWSGDVNAASL